MSDEPTIRIRDGSMVTREEYDMMEAQAKQAANRQAMIDSSLDYRDLVYELRTGEDGLEYAAADALEALMARIAALEATIEEYSIVEAKQKAALNYFLERDTDYSWRYKREEAESKARAALEGKDD